MKNMNICNNNDVCYTACYTSNRTLEALELVYQLGLGHKYYASGDLNKTIKKLLK